MSYILHILIAIALTILTQIGGVLWIFTFTFYKLSGVNKSKILSVLTFILLYIISTIVVVPPLAKWSGRVPMPFTKNGNLIPHNYITPLLNRHYVKPKLRTQLVNIANEINKENKDLKLSYLDANFPFIDGFPLLPHISHNDGRKIDLSFYYTKNHSFSNLKPANSGYGKYVEPNKNEFDQTKDCIQKGHWQYDYSKFLTFGSRDDLEFDEHNTRQLLLRLVKDLLTQKVLIEPHLKKRLGIDHDKLRFQGCHSVRHDDHIHLQIIQ